MWCNGIYPLVPRLMGLLTYTFFIYDDHVGIVEFVCGSMRLECKAIRWTKDCLCPPKSLIFREKLSSSCFLQLLSISCLICTAFQQKMGEFNHLSLNHNKPYSVVWGHKVQRNFFVSYAFQSIKIQDQTKLTFQLWGILFLSLMSWVNIVYLDRFLWWFL